MSIENLNLILSRIGKHIRRLDIFIPYANGEEMMTSPDLKPKLVFILSKIGHNKLEHFELTTDFPVHLESHDITALPPSFPRLRNLRVIFNHDRDEDEDNLDTEPPLEGTVPLISHLITLARSLKHVILPNNVQTQLQHDYALMALRQIQEHHQDPLPHISMSLNPMLYLPDLLELRGLTKMGFTFRNFSVDIDTFKVNATNMNNCMSWLAAQSSAVTSLTLRLNLWEPDRPYYDFGIRTIPTLAGLRELNLSFRDLTVDYNYNCPIRPLVSDQFPVLRKVGLNCYNDRLGIFNNSSLPLVQELHMRDQESFLTAPWDTIFPNLSTLHFETGVKSRKEDLYNLEFLFQYFPRITNLKLTLRNETDYRDVLTGGAPRPRSANDLLHGEMSHLGDLVNDRPSLRNLRGKKTTSGSRIHDLIQSSIENYNSWFVLPQS